ncbi:MAG: hypothetical protein ACT4QB_23605 [Gammaproteobacteria bacterium]
MTTNEPQQAVYTAVAELIVGLNAQRHHKLARTLEHRMYKVPWTSSSELFEELEKVLTNALTEYKALLDKQSLDKVRSTIELLNARASK